MGPEYRERHVEEAKQYTDEAERRIEQEPDIPSELTDFLKKYLSTGSEDTYKNVVLDEDVKKQLQDKEVRKDLTALREFNQGTLEELLSNEKLLEQVLQGSEQAKLLEEIKSKKKAIAGVVGIARVLKFFTKPKLIERIIRAKTLLKDLNPDARIEQLDDKTLNFLKILAYLS